MGKRLEVFSRPSFLIPLAALAVNDHLLKQTFPGWWTGKLSDVAGLFVVAAAIGSLTSMPKTAAGLAGVGFCALKLSSRAATIAAPVLGGVTRQDASDLFALIALFPAWRLARGQSRPFPFRGVVIVLSAAAMMLTLTATSCYRRTVDGFASGSDGKLYAHIAPLFRDTEDPGHWALSTDGGHTWREAPAAPEGPVASAKKACVGLHCFEISRNMRIDETSKDGSVRTTFRFTPEQVERMQAPGFCISTNIELNAIILVSRGQGQHVVVAAGEQGVIHRTVDGKWERRAVLDLRPLPIRGPSWLLFLGRMSLALIPLSLISLFLGRRRGGKDQGWRAFAFGAGGVLGVALIEGGALMFGVDYTFVEPLMAVASVCFYLVGLSIALNAQPPVLAPQMLAPPPPFPALHPPSLPSTHPPSHPPPPPT